jgi:hypothetical protein
LRLIKRLQAEDWQVELVYLALPSVEMSKLRVAERVAHGGHNIPVRDIERRFPRSLNNLFDLFSYAVDHCICFMNDGNKPVLLFEQHGENRKDPARHTVPTAIKGGECMSSPIKTEPSQKSQVMLDTLKRQWLMRLKKSGAWVNTQLFGRMASRFGSEQIQLA